MWLLSIIFFEVFMSLLQSEYSMQELVRQLAQQWREEELLLYAPAEWLDDNAKYAENPEGDTELLFLPSGLED
jgi:hypothetical protein